MTRNFSTTLGNSRSHLTLKSSSGHTFRRDIVCLEITAILDDTGDFSIPLVVTTASHICMTILHRGAVLRAKCSSPAVTKKRAAPPPVQMSGKGRSAVRRRPQNATGRSHAGLIRRNGRARWQDRGFLVTAWFCSLLLSRAFFLCKLMMRQISGGPVRCRVFLCLTGPCRQLGLVPTGLVHTGY
jgi:hypothetical protein